MIAGPIGKIVLGKDEVINGIMLADVIGWVSKLPGDTTVLWIDMTGPGGVKQEGDRICAYLESLKDRMEVNTNQVGPIGSVMTKLFLRGTKRVALDDGTKNWFIHNPWNRHEGDAKAHLRNVESLLVSEDELVQEYASYTKLEEKDLRPLMDSSASFDGLQAVAFGFATESTQALNIAAYINMKDGKTLTDKLNELIDKLKSGGKAPDSSKALALKLQLSDGCYLSVPDAADETQLDNQMVFTADNLGNPTSVHPIPGEHTLRSGKKIVVDDKGKITTTISAVAVAPELQVYEAQIEELKKLVEEHVAKPVSVEGMLTKKDLDEAILELKKGISTKHVPGKSSGHAFGVPVGVTKEDVLEWDRSLAAGEHLEMRQTDPEKWSRLYFAKYKVLPENV